MISFVEQCRQEINVRPVYWPKPPINMVKLNSDGSPLSNPGRIGACEVIRNHNGDLIYAYANLLGHGTNN